MSITAIAVDDEKYMLTAYKRILSQISSITLVDCFEDSEDVLIYFSRNKCDVVFLDIYMPFINGYQLAKRIKEINQDVKIVLVSALEGDTHGLADYYITKPIDRSEIIKSLEACGYDQIIIER